MSVTIVLADDHNICRRGLRLVLEEQEDFHVIAEATGGLEAIQLVQDMRPNVLIVDHIISTLSTLEVARQVRRQAPATHAVILSSYSDGAHVVEALRSGVFAYALKDSPIACLFEAVRETNTGRRYLSPPLSEGSVEAYLSQVPGTPMDPYDSLTTREREVLHLMARGLTNREIASTLFISPRTVETHRANFMSKLNLRSQAELIRYALRRGILLTDL